MQRFGTRFGAILGVILASVTLGGCAALTRPVVPVDFILVDKSARTLDLMRDGSPIRSYDVALGREPVGHKRQEGDGRTPEGLYYIDGRNPNSRFHLSLRISYPSPDDVASAAARGVRPGSDIMIHGLPNGVSAEAASLHPGVDWTDGCIAVTDEEIEEIWGMVADGTLVMIRP